jgi:hypothetical protein
MRHRWFCRLALRLGVLVLGHVGMAALPALAAETSVPVIQPYPPVESPAERNDEPPALASQSAAEVADPAPAATLDRPVALRDERNEVDSQVRPTGLFSGSGGNNVVLSPAGTYPVAQSLPAGSGSNPMLPMPAPVLSSPPPVLSSPAAVPSSPPPDVPYSWRQPPTAVPTAPNVSPSPLAPMPSVSGETGPIVGPTPLPGSIATPGVVPDPAIAAAPGVAAGPMGAPLVDGCMGNGCGAPGCCDGTCCDGCGGWGGCCGRGCCFGDHWYGSAEYLLWFIRGQNVPPLLTTGPLSSPLPGALGQPGTTVLSGNDVQANNPYSGLRLRGVYWLDDCHKWGLDVGGFFLGSGTNNTSITSLGVPFLARPFTNALTGAQDIEAVAAPSGLAGTFSTTSTFFLYGAEANLRRNLLCGCNWFIDGFVGWRLLGLNESLSMTENLAVVSSTNPSLPAGSTFVVNDRFGTSNLFNGGQIGLAGEYRLGRWFMNARTSIALGGTQQVVNISGFTTSAAPGIAATTLPGGLLAQSSNIGSHTRSMVSFVEEVGFNVGYQFTNHIRGFVGYNFLFWSSVVRPAEQIDTVVNPNLIPPAVGGGPARPQFSFNGSDFWVQGITAGFDIRW